MTRDICPSCGAWLILAEVQYVSPHVRPDAEDGSCLVYECPACKSVFERWMRDDAPLTAMSRRRISLRQRVAARRHVSEV
jgi:RNase P subunit RPR2